MSISCVLAITTCCWFNRKTGREKERPSVSVCEYLFKKSSFEFESVRAGLMAAVCTLVKGLSQRPHLTIWVYSFLSGLRRGRRDMVFWPGAWPSWIQLGFCHKGRRTQWMPGRLPCPGCRGHADGRSCSLNDAICQDVHQAWEVCGTCVNRWRWHLSLHLVFGWLVDFFIVQHHLLGCL